MASEVVIMIVPPFVDEEERVWTEDPTPQGPYQIG